jgi:hypothetical protein
MEEILQTLARQEEVLILIIVFTAVTIMSIFKALTRLIARLASERTRREIAAYIAEGSMTPDDGVKLLASNNKNNGKSGCG